MFKKLFLVLIFGALMGSVCFAQTAPAVSADETPTIEKSKDQATHKPKTVKKAKKKRAIKKTKEDKK